MTEEQLHPHPRPPIKNVGGFASFQTGERECGGQKEEEGKGKDKEPLSGYASLT